MTLDANLDHIIFMKVGVHAGETFESILERKRREYEVTGRTFWGYGGGTMHPLTRVQPFVHMHVTHGQRISIVMEEINSHHAPTEVFAKHFSSDGVTWERIPDGVKVTGSRYALVLDEIKAGDLELNLNEYVVGTGPSAGKEAAAYVRGRVDKGCLSRATSNQAAGEPKLVHVKHAAHLLAPYAVLLKA